MSKLNISWLSKLLGGQTKKTLNLEKDYLVIGSFEARGRTKESRARESESIISVKDFMDQIPPSENVPEPAAPKFLEYMAYVDQSETSDPVDFVLYNDFPGAHWVRTGQSVYEFRIPAGLADYDPTKFLCMVNGAQGSELSLVQLIGVTFEDGLQFTGIAIAFRRYPADSGGLVGDGLAALPVHVTYVIPN